MRPSSALTRAVTSMPCVGVGLLSYTSTAALISLLTGNSRRADGGPGKRPLNGSNPGFGGEYTERSAVAASATLLSAIGFRVKSGTSMSKCALPCFTLPLSCAATRTWYRPVGSDKCRSRRTPRSEEHTSELQSRLHLVCRLLLEKKKT